VSGIASVTRRDGVAADAAALWAMLLAAPHRGPDGMQARVLGPAALGHAHLDVQPGLSPPVQPLLSPRTGCSITADVRLDNRRELLPRLAIGLPTGMSDAEVILRAYEAWGSACFDQLEGDFAFVIWDPRERLTVCARDGAGQRSLFYRLDHSTLAVASEIQQLLQDPSVTIAPDEQRIHDYLLDLHAGRNEKDHPATFYAGVHSVPAGHALEVTPTATRVRRFAELRMTREIRYRHSAEYEDHFRTLLFQAVGDRLAGAAEVGLLLSGGLDSSSIAGAAQALGTSVRVHGFSAVYDGLDCDERPFIHAVERQTGLEAHHVVARGDAARRLQLEPSGFLEAPSMWAGAERDALLAAATRTGVRILLTGEVADSCLSGTRLVFDSLLRHGRLARLWQDLRAYRRTSADSTLPLLALYCLAPLLPLQVQRGVGVWRLRRTFRALHDSLLPGWLAEPLADELRQHVFERAATEIRTRRFASPARDAQYRLLEPPEAARTFAPWPLTVSRPFADRRLHAFLLSIPPEEHFRPDPRSDDYYAGSKWLLRRAMRGLIPESVRTRTTKTAFNATFQDELIHCWPAYAAAFSATARPRIAERGYVDQGRFWARLQRMRAEGSGADFVYVLRLVELETWLRALEQPRPSLVRLARPPAQLGGAGDQARTNDRRFAVAS
jgi:asparagine synthase (glutamine-hydrolysing)